MIVFRNPVISGAEHSQVLSDELRCAVRQLTLIIAIKKGDDNS